MKVLKIFLLVFLGVPFGQWGNVGLWPMIEEGLASERQESPQARLQFLREDWQVLQDGEIKAGGELFIQHDDERLPYCRGRYNGYRAWTILAFVQFFPGGKIMVEDVTEEKVAKVDIPLGTEELQIWFFNSGRCQRFYYDSNFSQNFHFQVEK